MRPGDIVIINLPAPHIASVIDENSVICEDGTLLAYDKSVMSKLYDALQIIHELESGVLKQHETG